MIIGTAKEWIFTNLRTGEKEVMTLIVDQQANDDFHKHLEECTWCDEHPFQLCATGQELLLKTFGMWVPPDEKRNQTKR